MPRISVNSKVLAPRSPTALLDAIAEARKTANSSPRPILLLSGGEANVRVRGSGQGGPNSQLLLELAQPPSRPERYLDPLRRHRWHRRHRTACRWDCQRSLLERARDLGLDLAAAIDSNDSLRLSCPPWATS